MSYQKAIIVGASSGIGAELVKLLARGGSKVAAVARRKDRLDELKKEVPDRILVFEHDVTDFEAVPGLFQDITKQLEGLDLIVYSAGAMPEVGRNEYDFKKDKQIVDVNLLGCIAWMNQAAIRFENTRSGTMVALGSVAGDRGRAGQPVYNTSKAAVATYMEALRNRLAKVGVKVATIKPGPTRTEMTSHLDTRSMMSPRDVAMAILAKSRTTGEHYVKLSHRLIFYVLKRIPSPVFRRLEL